MKISEQDRFFGHVDWDGPEVEGRPELGRCWLWTGATNQNGHGVFRGANGKLLSAHRFPYQLRYGETVRHLRQICSIPACVNPLHQAEGPTPEKITSLLKNSKGAMVDKAKRALYWQQRRLEQDGAVTSYRHDRSAYAEKVPEVAKKWQATERMKNFRALKNPLMQEAMTYAWREEVLALQVAVNRLSSNVSYLSQTEWTAFRKRILNLKVPAFGGRKSPVHRTLEEKVELMRKEAVHMPYDQWMKRELLEGKIRQLESRIEEENKKKEKEIGDGAA